ncbi:hypothetical protein HMN09_00644100 [Mycena chlorophos]|uniref:Uncharacterized protein n=1 Tax=Mycena chlorophos TaxID=658473 RepID=A0A8H6T6S4_MYCCL|nr:hypothetical protein HMN09_00644100 [Mycena chlorophos]
MDYDESTAHATPPWRCSESHGELESQEFNAVAQRLPDTFDPERKEPPTQENFPIDFPAQFRGSSAPVFDAAFFNMFPELVEAAVESATDAMASTLREQSAYTTHAVEDAGFLQMEAVDHGAVAPSFSAGGWLHSSSAPPSVAAPRSTPAIPTRFPDAGAGSLSASSSISTSGFSAPPSFVATSTDHLFASPYNLLSTNGQWMTQRAWSAPLLTMSAPAVSVPAVSVPSTGASSIALTADDPALVSIEGLDILVPTGVASCVEHVRGVLAGDALFDNYFSTPTYNEIAQHLESAARSLAEDPEEPIINAEQLALYTPHLLRPPTVLLDFKRRFKSSLKMASSSALKNSTFIVMPTLNPNTGRAFTTSQASQYKIAQWSKLVQGTKVLHFWTDQDGIEHQAPFQGPELRSVIIALARHKYGASHHQSLFKEGSLFPAGLIALGGISVINHIQNLIAKETSPEAATVALKMSDYGVLLTQITQAVATIRASRDHASKFQAYTDEIAADIRRLAFLQVPDVDLGCFGL